MNWRVSDVNGRIRYLSRLAVAKRQRLAKSLDAVEHAGSRCSVNTNLLGISVERIAFGIANVFVDRQNYSSASFCQFADSGANACGLLNV